MPSSNWPSLVWPPLVYEGTSMHGARRRLLWRLIRYLMPRGFRFFYEGRPPLRGQLWFHERRWLFEAVRRYHPKNCFEVGTWEGGGSTLVVAQALLTTGGGMLHTVELNAERHKTTTMLYKLVAPECLPFVRLLCGDYTQVLSSVLAETGRVDLLILDGAEDAEENLAQYRYFEPYLHLGAMVFQHDWLTEKARLVRPLLEDTLSWDLEWVLLPPFSRGFALAIKK